MHDAMALFTVKNVHFFCIHRVGHSIVGYTQTLIDDFFNVSRHSSLRASGTMRRLSLRHAQSILWSVGKLRSRNDKGIRVIAYRTELRDSSHRCFSTSNNTAIVATSQHVPIEPFTWYNPLQYLMEVVHTIHDVTGLPYAGCILGVTALGRIALFPLMIFTQRFQIRQEEAQSELSKFQKKRPSKTAFEAKKKALMKQYDYEPLQRYTLPAANIALTLYMWLGLRSMGDYFPAEFSTGGILWFTDLTQTDPSNTLPILSGVVSVLVTEMGTDFRQSMSPRRKLVRRVITAVMIPIFFTLPASVHLFWTTTWLISGVQDVVVSQPAVREKLGIARPNEERPVKPVVFIQEMTNGKRPEQRSDEKVETVSAGRIKTRTKKHKKRR